MTDHKVRDMLKLLLYFVFAICVVTTVAFIIVVGGALGIVLALGAFDKQLDPVTAIMISALIFGAPVLAICLAYWRKKLRQSGKQAKSDHGAIL